MELKGLKDSIDRVLDLNDDLILLVECLSLLIAPMVLASRCWVMSIFLISRPTPGSTSESNGWRFEALRECSTMV
jgi:hypothetical protein